MMQALRTAKTGTGRGSWTCTRPRGSSPLSIQESSYESIPWSDPSQAYVRGRAGRLWRQNAIEQLKNIDSGIEEEGLESPTQEARDLAEEFIGAFAKLGLPNASVFADEDCSVSIQMEASGFAFLLTCSEGGRGIYNIARRTNDSVTSLEASYTIVSSENIGESSVFKQLRCLIEPLTEHARRTDQVR